MLLTCTSHLSARGSVASIAAEPSSPPTGQWPIWRARAALRPVRKSSSSAKKVPSKKTASASRSARSTRGRRAGHRREPRHRAAAPFVADDEADVVERPSPRARDAAAACPAPARPRSSSPATLTRASAAEIDPARVIGEAAQRRHDAVVVDDVGAHRRRGEQRQRRPLAQRQQADPGVDVAVGQRHRGDGRSPVGGRPQLARALDLRAHVGRSAEQDPALTVRRDGERRLRARRGAQPAAAHADAVGAGAVPLREAAAGGRAEHAQPHG